MTVAAPLVAIALVDGPWLWMVFAFSGPGQFALMFGLLAISLGAFFMVSVLMSGWAFINRPFEIDADTGTTTDAHGRQWVRERHGPAKVMLTQAGPAAIVFPAFDIVGGTAPAPTSPRRTGRIRRFLQRTFAGVFLGVRGTEIDGLFLPVGYLSDRKAIMAAIKPVPPPFRWF